MAKGGTSLYRSMPTTLAMNMPYNSLMMMCNESMRKWLNPSGDFNFKVYLLSGCVSGAFAAALTTPLDVIRAPLVAPPATSWSRAHPFSRPRDNAFCYSRSQARGTCSRPNGGTC